ncbi:hypothetical protein J3E69DRAFT_339916 [Trichoderma sp. SZMC 28015]
MSDFVVPLAEIEGSGGTYRSRDLQGRDFRHVLQIYGRHGQSFVARAEILLVCSGKLKDGGNGTLIMFRFTFSVFEKAVQRRFTSAKISVEFSDLLSRMVNDPEVVTILPDRAQDFDLITVEREREVEAAGNAGISAGLGDVGAEVRWKESATTSQEYYARLRAVKFNNRYTFMGEDNCAIWKLDEHNSKKKGLPDRFQTAVILRRNGDGKFQMKINIETTVDKRTTTGELIKKMIGRTQPEPVDPINIDSQLFVLKEVEIPGLAKVRTGEMALDDLDLTNHVGLV